MMIVYNEMLNLQSEKRHVILRLQIGFCGSCNGQHSNASKNFADFMSTFMQLYTGVKSCFMSHFSFYDFFAFLHKIFYAPRR